jgi:hypothetical protein
MNKILRGIPVSHADNDSSREPGGGYSGGLSPSATSGQEEVFSRERRFCSRLPLSGDEGN